MNNKEVYINGILCDLDEANNPIQLIYAINDLAELKDRQAYSTNTFKLPPTQNNLRACGLPGNANLIQEAPYRKNTGKIIQGGIEVLPNGVAIINKTNKDIEVQILSGLIGFFDAIGDKNIRDLDLSEYDHTWDLSTVVLSRSRTDGYIYPIIDYAGNMSETTRSVDVRNLRPATFRKTIIEKIISEAGYTASGSYTSYEKYYNSIIPFTNDSLSHDLGYEDFLKSYDASARKTVVQAFDPQVTQSVITFEDDATTDKFNAWNGSQYTSQIVTKLNVVVSYTIEQVWTGLTVANADVFIILQQSNSGGAWFDVKSVSTRSSKKYLQETFPQTFDTQIDVKAGDRLRVIIRKNINWGIAVVRAGSSIAFNTVYQNVVYGGKIQLSATLPDISQKNFFKDFLQNFGLIVIPDNYKKELLLINMEDVYANKPIAEDISDKLIDAPDNVSYSLKGYGINNYGKYKDDEAVADGVGDGNMILDNLTLEDNVNLFTSVFAASQSVNRLGGLNVVQINKGPEFKIKTQPRILLNNLVSTQFTWFDGSGTFTLYSSFISLPTFAGLDYQTLFNENYPEIKRMLFRPFVVIKPILLNETDIANIDWRVPVYDRKSASYYYKNQITYMQGDVSTISLIKLP